MSDNIMTAEQPPALIVQGPRQRSAQWGDLMVSLAKAQGEIEAAKKGSLNPAFKQPGQPEGSKYADLASVWDAIREPMSKHGLAIMQWPRVTEGAVEIETIVAHGEQFISDVLWMPCSKMDAHGIGSAITYGRRYALMAVAGVAPEDDDGNGAVTGAPGMAGGGGDFRPAGRRPVAQSSWGAGGKPAAVAEAQRDDLIPAPKTKPAADAIALAAWCKEAIKALKDMKTKAALKDWWRQNEQQREDAEAAMPTEWDRVLVVFDDQMTTAP